MWTKPRSLSLSRLMVAVFMVTLVAGSLALPWLLRQYSVYYGRSAVQTQVMAALWACAVPAFAALRQLGKMLRNIAADQVFVQANIHALRVISWCCFAVSFVFCFFMLYYILGLILVILAAFAGLILRVVKNVFEQAVGIKEENDLTV